MSNISLPLRGIAAGLLFKRRTLEALLPDKRGDGLNFVGLETELRHFRGGIELPRVAEPVRNPIRIQLHANFFQVRADALHFLLQAVAQFVKLFDARVNFADIHGEICGLRVELLRSGVVRGLVARFVELRNGLIVVGLFFFETGDFADGVLELLTLIVKTGVIMAADAALFAI